LVAIKKSRKKETGAPIIDLPQAKIKIVEAELRPERYEVTSNSGETFTIDPNLNCQLEITDDLADGEYDGVRFYDTFKLKEADDGTWELRDGTKFGALAKARYGQDFFETDQAFDSEDLEEFEFLAKIEPKTNFRTGKITGSMLGWETIMAIPKPKKKKKNLQAAQQEAAKAANEADFAQLPLSDEDEALMNEALG